MDKKVPVNQDPGGFLQVSHPHRQQQGNTNQQTPPSGTNVPLNHESDMVSFRTPTQCNGNTYIRQDNVVPHPSSNNLPATGAPPYVNTPQLHTWYPQTQRSNWSHQSPSHGPFDANDACGSIPIPRQSQHNQSSSSPIINVHIHKYYVENAQSPSNLQPMTGAQFNNYTQSSFKSQSSSIAQHSTPQRHLNHMQNSFRRNSNPSSGNIREPRLFVSSETSTPCHNRTDLPPGESDGEGEGYQARFNANNVNSVQIRESTSSTPQPNSIPVSNRIEQLPSSPLPTNMNNPSSPTNTSSATPIAASKLSTKKRKFKMSMADVESTIGDWSGKPKPITLKSAVVQGQGQNALENRLDTASTKTNSRVTESKADQTHSRLTAAASEPGLTRMNPDADNPPSLHSTSHTTPAVQPALNTRIHDSQTTKSTTENRRPTQTNKDTLQVTNSQPFSQISSKQKPTSSLPQHSTAQNRQTVVIELSDDESDTKPAKLLPPPVAPKSSIIIIDSDDEDENEPVKPASNQSPKIDTAANTSLISSPIQVRPRPDLKDTSDPIVDSSFSFSKAGFKPVEEVPELPKADPKSSAIDVSREASDVDIDVPEMPDFISWSSSDGEENKLDIALTSTKATTISGTRRPTLKVANSSQRPKDGATNVIQKSACKSNSSASLGQATQNNLASRSKSVPDSRFSGPVTESSLHSIKRSNTSQDGDVSVSKKARRSKTDSLLEELPKIDNFEYSYKELQEANRVNRKKEELHAEMEIYISSKPYSVLKEFTEDFKSNVATFESEVPVVYWKRNVKAEYIKEKDYFIPVAAKKVVQQTFVIYYLAQDFMDKLISNKLGDDVRTATEQMWAISNHDYHVILMVEGYDQLIKKIKAYIQRQFRSQVLNGEEQARKKKDDELFSKFPEPTEIAKLFNKAQLDLKINIYPVRSRQEGVMWLNSFTYTIGSSLYDKYERNQKLANLGVVRSGSDTKATFLQSIQHFPRMTHSKAQILESSYGSMHSIYSKFRTSGTLGKDSLGRNVVPPTVDSTMLNFFTSDDPDKAIT
ncbi:EME1 [Candida theae]|uniref:EME1 n=1 Tax=Candida theae TaxID=1198502 RepID=A0AAD5BI42_9ASCO|nr:EME1 [Candida theae]KAI5964527.1 EME1 [Candida theae]